MLCGSPQMIADTRTLLDARGFAEGNHAEPGHYVVEKAFGGALATSRGLVAPCYPIGRSARQSSGSTLDEHSPLAAIRHPPDSARPGAG